MSSLDIQQKIDQYPYVDARIKRLNCDYFGDEVELIYENSDDYDICCKFLNCFRVSFNHILGYDKLFAVKDMTYGQMPYFMFDISVNTVVYEAEEFYNVKLDLGLLEVEVLCKDVMVDKISYLNTKGKLCADI